MESTDQAPLIFATEGTSSLEVHGIYGSRLMQLYKVIHEKL